MITAPGTLYAAFETSLHRVREGVAGARTHYVHSLLRLGKSEANSLAGYNSSSPSAESRTIVAAGLAHLMRLENGDFEDFNFSIETFKIFDSVFAPVYKSRGLTARDQTHLKRQAILDQLDEITQPLAIYVGSVIQREQLGEARGIVERFYRNSMAALLVWPLVAPALRDRGPIIEIFAEIERALTTHDRSLDDIERVRELYSKHEALLAECGSSLYQSIVEPIIGTVFRSFEELIGADPAFQPTKLSLAFPTRRYPFNSKGAAVSIRATVHNQGPGRASNVSIHYQTSVSAGPRSINVGSVAQGYSSFDLADVVEDAGEEAIVMARVEWSDVDGHHQSDDVDVVLKAQRGNVDWQTLRYSDPYSTEPVDSVGQLIGRSEQLGLMKTQYLGRVMPSYFITGQKRVGKTSLAKTLCQTLNADASRSNIHTIYLEGGDYIAADGAGTIHRLCSAIRTNVVSRFPTIAFSQIDRFGESLSDLKPFFDQVWLANPETRILIALDEFDELPFELFIRGAMSRSVFLALRGLSAKAHLGFAIIGSEKMSLIINEQGEHLNKWDSVSLDYFDKRSQWTDYNELVTRPVHQSIDFGEDSVSALYDLTAGHPFFTKLLCRRILEDACDRQISYIDSSMVTQAATVLCDGEDVNRFQHFWEDGIFETPDAQAKIVERRKRILLAAADLLRAGKSLTSTALVEHRLLAGRGSEVEGELKSFERRNILTYVKGIYDFKIPLFRQWLTGVGSAKILVELPSSDAIASFREEQALRVSHSEIVGLCRDWTYRWRKINPDDVRAWLEQFGSPDAQRLMFTLLKNLRYYSGDVYGIKLQEAYRALAHRYVRFREANTIKRGDILVSYLDGPGKSGSQLAKIFVAQNKIYVGNVVEQAKLADRIDAEKDLQAVVCIDDFAGSGRTAVTGLRRMWKSIGAKLVDRKIDFHFIAIAGFSAAISNLQETADTLGGKIFINVLDLLTDSDRAFSEESLIFDSTEDRLRARDIAHNIGKTLTSNAPLGHNSDQALVIFDTNCPNNSLPILWSNAKGWRPLFERV